MSSILTNNGAMVALQTLKSINSDLNKTQSMISTGKHITSSKDNAAIWAISKVMEADMRGFKGISDSLSLGQSTVALARQGAETVTDLLTQMKEKIVAAQESNVDRAKIQTDIVALRNQIGSVVGAAQFNGLNLLSNASNDAASGRVNVLSSLDRSGTGVVASDISVAKVDLSTRQQSFTGGTFAAGTGGATATLAATQTGTLTIAAPTAGGQVYSIGLGAGANFAGVTSTATTVAGAQNIAYVSRAGDTAGDVAKGLARAYETYASANNITAAMLSITATATGLTVASTTSSGTSGNNIAVSVDTVTAPTTAVSGGGLAALANISVTNELGADNALSAIEGLIQTAVDAAAAFGSVEKRIETQGKFVSNLMDSMKAGIGTLVDANMEEASARLQALQVQQQLGIQALSIANQAPQSLLSLFRG